MSTQSIPFDRETTLLNGTQLAERLGIDRRFITAMRHAGFSFNLGGRCTLAKAMKWLEDNQSFKPPARAKKKKKKAKGALQPA